MALSKRDLRVAAGPIIPEVLPPDTSAESRFLDQYHQGLDALVRRAQELIKSVGYYGPRVRARKDLWNVNQVIERMHDAMYDQVEALRRIESAWEDEEIQAEDAAMQQGRRR